MITKTYLQALKQAELAALLGVSDRWIRKLTDEGLPGTGVGPGRTYDWQAVLAWRDRRSSGSNDPAQLSHADRLKKVQADDAELDLAVKQKTLMEASRVREVWSKSKAAVRARLLSIPSTAAVRIDPSHTQAQREVIIRKDIYEALELLAGGDL